jgi:hypothetical protein
MYGRKWLPRLMSPRRFGRERPVRVILRGGAVVDAQFRRGHETEFYYVTKK